VQLANGQIVSGHDENVILIGNEDHFQVAPSQGLPVGDHTVATTAKLLNWLSYIHHFVFVDAVNEYVGKVSFRVNVEPHTHRG
jgi:hypothetical protein